jgi:hypothetical protein
VGADRQGDIVNELIKEFEKQCWDHQTNHVDVEKFAELIVKECLRVCDRRGAYEVMDDIIDHFGVEI